MVSQTTTWGKGGMPYWRRLWPVKEKMTKIIPNHIPEYVRAVAFSSRIDFLAESYSWDPLL